MNMDPQLMKLIIRQAYPALRNMLLYRALKKFLKGYTEFKKNEELERFRILNTCDNVDVVPYVNAKTALAVLNCRGGDDGTKAMVALYQIIRILEKYVQKIIPKQLLIPFLYWQEQKKKYPILEYIEDVLVICTSLRTGSIVASKDAPYDTTTISFDNPDLVEEFKEFLNKEGTNPDACDDNVINLMKIIATDCDIELKLGLFKAFAINLCFSSNASERQGYLLCMISFIAYIFLFDRGLAIKLLSVLLKLYKEGKLSKSILMHILKKLKGKGHDIPRDLVPDTW